MCMPLCLSVPRRMRPTPCHLTVGVIARRRSARVAPYSQNRACKTRAPNEKGAQGNPRAPNPKPSLEAKDYLLEAAEAASAAAEPAAEAAESADEAAEVATSAADEATESADEAESVEAASPPLQADRVRAAPATAAARMILRMNGIP